MKGGGESLDDRFTTTSRLNNYTLRQTNMQYRAVIFYRPFIHRR